MTGSAVTYARSHRAAVTLVVGVLSVLMLPGAIGPSSRERPGAASAPSLVFSDNFNGPAGRPPNRAGWGYDVGRWNHGAGELQYYTARARNARLDGHGNLEIVARADRYGGAMYTSARLQTRQRHAFRPPVRIAARIQMPAGTGLLSSFWTLGTDVFTRGWPKCGEIDIAEVKGDTPSAARFHTHSAWPSGADHSVGRTWTAPQSLAGGFHAYRIDWYDARIEFYVDDALRFTITRAAMPRGTWAFSGTHYLTLNTAVGNEWTGPPDRTTRWPAVMRVDWVKAWALR